MIPGALRGFFFLRGKAAGPDGIKGQKSRPPSFLALKVTDGLLGRLGITGNDVLQSPAKRRFNGRYIAAFDMEQLAHNAADSAAPACF